MHNTERLLAALLTCALFWLLLAWSCSAQAQVTIPAGIIEAGKLSGVLAEIKGD